MVHWWFTGTSGLGVDHNGVTVNVLSGGIIRAGFGGGGGGGGGRQTDKGSDRRSVWWRRRWWCWIPCR